MPVTADASAIASTVSSLLHCSRLGSSPIAFSHSIYGDPAAEIG